MCGIFAHICNSSDCKVKYDSSILKHRGPDFSGKFIYKNIYMAHERLRLVGSDGNQPIIDEDLRLVLVVNGEIYNYKELYANIGANIYFKPVSNSDCAVLIYLYYYYGEDFLEKVKINGMYSFVLYDINKNKILIGRDHIGIIPLYYGFATNQNSSCIVFASEMKALQFCNNVFTFPIGAYISYKCKETKQLTQSMKNVRKFYKHIYIPHSLEYQNLESINDDIRNNLIKSVKNHLMINKNNKFGILLSGGVDSSIIAAITVSLWDNLCSQEENYRRLDSFCIGLDELDVSNSAPDLDSAKIVGKFLGTNHHTFTFTIKEGLDSIEDVIWYIETYDVTTVRASIPMFLLAKKIRSLGIKMVLSGEGADEIFGGYSYFKFAPDVYEFHAELVRKVKALHLYDCLRANKSMMAESIEVRAPFLDIDFLNYVMRINPAYKFNDGKQIEKKILRDAFMGFLPDEILYRPKEQFSDGVGNRWIESLKAFTAEKNMTELEYYKSIFDKKFKIGGNTVSATKSIACSTEIATEWITLKNKQHDPSGYITEKLK